MKSSTLTPAVEHPAASTDREESLRHLPAAARAAFERFQAGGDSANLDPVMLAILADFIPRPPVAPLADLPGTTLLIDDLGFDSLAITEVVFFTEDLFGINISNQEIIQVRTLDDLRGFIRRKVTVRPNR
jgi:acyl carrier protein